MSLPTLEGYMPDFSGFSSPAWAPLLSGARDRAAGARAFLQMHHEFDREDFLKFFAEAAVRDAREIVLPDLRDPAGAQARNSARRPLRPVRSRVRSHRGARPARDRAQAPRPLRGKAPPVARRPAARRVRGALGLRLGGGRAPERGGEPGVREDGCRRGRQVAARVRQPRIEKKAIREITVEATAQAFADSIDPDKYRIAKERRRREKHAFAFGPSGNA